MVLPTTVQVRTTVSGLTYATLPMQSVGRGETTAYYWGFLMLVAIEGGPSSVNGSVVRV